RVTAMARALAPQGAGLTGTYSQANGVISVTTAAPHRMGNNTVMLNFSGGVPNDAPSGSYSITSTGENTFTTKAKDSLAATYATTDFNYSQTGNEVTVTLSNHGFVNGEMANLQFNTPAASTPASGSYPVTFLTTSTFRVTVPDAVSRTGAGKLRDTITLTSSAHGFGTGNALYLHFPSEPALSKTYVVKGRSTNTFMVRVNPPAVRAGSAVAGFLRGDYVQSDTTITIDTEYEHALAVGAKVLIDFDLRNGQNTVAADGEYTVSEIVSPLSFRVTAADSASRSGYVAAGPATPVLERSGSLTNTFNTFLMNSTDTDLAQTPLRAPTVFNFFEPDYQFPGILSAAGLVTPEFQLTSDTNVMRQSNFLYNGLFSGSTSAGLSSFKSGNGQLWLDLGRWLGDGPGGQSWAADANLPALLEELNTLLMAGQMTNAMKNVILDYIKGPATGTKYFRMDSPPTATQKRDRVRAIVHLIVTSPDFTIQR
ncbi:MAG: hypothetical protein ACO1QR_00765, partial [Chthoniobacteraceae bacterium]